MTTRKKPTLQQEVRSLADALGLRDWTIDVELLGAEPGHLAEVSCVPGRKYATVTIGASFFDVDADEQFSTLIHELIHCHLDPIYTLTQKPELPAALGALAHGLFTECVHDAIEFAVDGIAVAVAPLLKEGHGALAC